MWNGSTTTEQDVTATLALTREIISGIISQLCHPKVSACLSKHQAFHSLKHWQNNPHITLLSILHGQPIHSWVQRLAWASGWSAASDGAYFGNEGWCNKIKRVVLIWPAGWWWIPNRTISSYLLWTLVNMLLINAVMCFRWRWLDNDQWWLLHLLSLDTKLISKSLMVITCKKVINVLCTNFVVQYKFSELVITIGITFIKYCWENF